MADFNRTEQAADVFNEKRKPKAPIKKLNTTLNEEQKAVKECAFRYDVNFIFGRAAAGKTLTATNIALDMLFKGDVRQIIVCRPFDFKATGYLTGPQPLYSKVLTPTGWSTVGELNINDYVVNSKGQPVRIKDKTSVVKDLVYTIRTTDGRVTECTNDHLFFTQTFNDKKHFDANPEKYKGSVKSVGEIIDTFLTKTKKVRLNHYIPYNEPVNFSSTKNHLINPYLLGVLLGNGSFASGGICFASVDQECIDKCRSICEDMGMELTSPSSEDQLNYQIKSLEDNCKPGKPVIIKNLSTGDTKVYSRIGDALKEVDILRATLHHRCNNNSTIDGIQYSFGELTHSSTNKVKNELIRLGLFGHKSNSKFIPKEYIYNSSVEDRLWLLKGLMDTDGCNDGNSAAYTTVSKQLAQDIIELVRSLGGRAGYYTRDRRDEVGNRSIMGREIRNRQISHEVTITVDYNPFYISRKANKYAPKYRHFMGIESITPSHETYVQCLKLESEDGLYITDDYIVTHNSLDEKLMYHMMPILHNFYQAYDHAKIDELYKEGSIKILPIPYLRGCTFSNAVVICDEIQEMDYESFELVLTRLGKGSKILFTGSMEQNVLGSKSCIEKVMKLKDSDLVCFHELKENHRNEAIFGILDYIKNN